MSVVSDWQQRALVGNASRRKLGLVSGRSRFFAIAPPGLGWTWTHWRCPSVFCEFPLNAAVEGWTVVRESSFQIDELALLATSCRSP